MNEPTGTPSVTSDRPISPDTSDSHLTTERRSVRLSPKWVLLILIGSCYAFGYAIYLLLKGMRH
jgi:hypothetical protein